MTNIRKFLTLILLFGIEQLYAQNSNAGNVEMADDFRNSGKIYVVIAVVLIILSGLLIYVATIDRKISRMEKDIEAKK